MVLGINLIVLIYTNWRRSVNVNLLICLNIVKAGRIPFYFLKKISLFYSH